MWAPCLLSATKLQVHPPRQTAVFPVFFRFRPSFTFRSCGRPPSVLKFDLRPTPRSHTSFRPFLLTSTRLSSTGTSTPPIVDFCCNRLTVSKDFVPSPPAGKRVPCGASRLVPPSPLTSPSPLSPRPVHPPLSILRVTSPRLVVQHLSPVAPRLAPRDVHAPSHKISSDTNLIPAGNIPSAHVPLPHFTAFAQSSSNPRRAAFPSAPAAHPSPSLD